MTARWGSTPHTGRGLCNLIFPAFRKLKINIPAMYEKFITKQKPRSSTDFVLVSKCINTSSGEEKYLWFFLLREAAAHRCPATAAAPLPDRFYHSESQGNGVCCLFTIDFSLLVQQEVCSTACSFLSFFLHYQSAVSQRWTTDCRSLQLIPLQQMLCQPAMYSRWWFVCGNMWVVS